MKTHLAIKGSYFGHVKKVIEYNDLYACIFLIYCLFGQIVICWSLGALFSGLEYLLIYFFSSFIPFLFIFLFCAGNLLMTTGMLSRHFATELPSELWSNF